MLKRLGLLTAFFMLLQHTCLAASQPAVLKNTAPNFNDSLQRSTVTGKTIQPKFITKLKRAMAAKLLRNQLRRAANPKSKNTLSIISLIAGVLGLACLASIMLAPVALLLAPTAIVTGIVALHHNKDKGSRTQAIVGIIAGAVPVIFIIIVAIIFASGGFWVE